MDSSHGLNAALAKDASSCCQLMVKSALRAWHFFLSFSILTNLMQKNVNVFDQLHGPQLFVCTRSYIIDTLNKKFMEVKFVNY